MDLVEFILYVLAYTLGVITLFLELVCYKKNIEYLETILFTAAFLFFIIALSINLFLGNPQNEGGLNNLVLFSMILLALTTPLNIFAERQVNISKSIKAVLYIGSLILTIMLALKIFNILDLQTELIITICLASSVIASMILIRRTKPEKRILHREKSERIFSLLLLLILPIVMFIEFVGPQIFNQGFPTSRISITPPVLFIILAVSKLTDDFNRLSLFSTDNKMEEQNAKNFNLTPREMEIADLLIKGHSYANISESLFIAMPTVKTHVRNIYRKVQVNNKIELLNALKS